MTLPDDKLKHKPSEKRTLDEVLKSLQDLIRNDVVSGAPAGQPARTHEASLSSAPSMSAEADSFNTALDNLDTLIASELATPPTPPARDQIDGDLGDAGHATEDQEIVLEIEGAAAPEESPAAVLQTTFGFDEPASVDRNGPSAESIEEVVATAVPEAEFVLDAPAPVATPAPDLALDPPMRRRDDPPLAGDDNIPTLHESVADLTTELTLEAIPQTATVAAPAEPAPPGSDPSRMLAIKIVAQLNIELRQAGEPPLKPRTIDRLQRLLCDALSSKH